MKNTIFILLLFPFLAFSQLTGMEIEGIIPVPVLSNDSTFVIVSSDFTSGDCGLENPSIMLENDTLTLSTDAVAGMLTVICSSVDTFYLGSFSEGNYTLIVNASGSGATLFSDTLDFEVLENPNSPYCSELNILDISPDSSQQNVLVTVSNASLDFYYPYPSFILLNASGDTVAVEPVYYFGIGEFPQVHTLNVTGQLALPLVGSLHLYSSFTDSLECIFGVSLPASRNVGLNPVEYSFGPNPLNDILFIHFQSVPTTPVSTRLLDVTGKVVSHANWERQAEIEWPIDAPNAGIYFLEVAVNQTTSRHKLILLK